LYLQIYQTSQRRDSSYCSNVLNHKPSLVNLNVLVHSAPRSLLNGRLAKASLILKYYLFSGVLCVIKGIKDSLSVSLKRRESMGGKALVLIYNFLLDLVACVQSPKSCRSYLFVHILPVEHYYSLLDGQSSPFS
jgi:hypothetical protein